MRSAKPSLEMIGGLDDQATIITRDLVERAKPDPDLFIAAANKLDMAIEDCIIVGDSVWDMLAAQLARAVGVGFGSGGYGDDEFRNAGAYRVYDDPRDLLDHLDEIGVRASREHRSVVVEERAPITAERCSRPRTQDPRL